MWYKNSYPVLNNLAVTQPNPNPRLQQGEISQMHLTNTKIVYRALCIVSLLLSSCGGSSNGALGTTTTRYAYVANFGTNNVSQYSIEANGALVLKTTVATVSGPTSVTVDPSGKYVYAANSLDSVISQYKIMAGVLTPMTPAATEQSGLPGSAPVSVTVEPTGKYAYAANSGSNDVTQFSIDATTGALTNLATVPAGMSPTSVTVASDPAGNKYAYVVNAGIPSCVLPCVAVAPSISQFSINPATGALSPTVTVTLAMGTAPASITIDPSGQYAYLANHDSNTVSQFDIVAGLLSPMSTPTVGGGGTALTVPTSIAVDPTGTYAYVANGSGVYQYSITNGELIDNMSPPTILTGGTTPRSVAVDVSGKYVYVANQGDGSISQFTIGLGGVLSTPTVISGALNSQPYSITTAVSAQ
jgi:YVTN family beta-propeller protein